MADTVSSYQPPPPAYQAPYNGIAAAYLPDDSNSTPNRFPPQPFQPQTTAYQFGIQTSAAPPQLAQNEYQSQSAALLQSQPNTYQPDFQAPTHLISAQTYPSDLKDAIAQCAPVTSQPYTYAIDSKDPTLFVPPPLPGSQPFQPSSGNLEKDPTFFSAPPQQGGPYSYPPEKDPSLFSPPAPPYGYSDPAILSPPPQYHQNPNATAANENVEIPVFASPPAQQKKVKDEKKTGSAKRFLGDTLVGRFARSAVQTTTNTIRVKSYLSSWGDNDVVALPNVRYRDAALFATFSVVGVPLLESGGDALGGVIGCDQFAASVIDPVVSYFVYNTVAKYALFQIIEQAIDKGILEHILPEEEKMLRTTHMRTLQCVVKHKLMDVDADLRFWEAYPSPNSQSCEKGWFAPYFFASNRTPKIPRQDDFLMGQFFGPFLKGDQLLGKKLLSECSAVLSLCNADPEIEIGCSRLLITFVGITPYRAGMWSTSRRPGASLMNYHLFNGCPALVVPITNQAPIIAWSPITLASMIGSTGKGPKSTNYDPALHHEAFCEYLDGLIDKSFMTEKLKNSYEAALSRAVSMVINGVLGLKRAREEDPKMMKGLDFERAGIAMFRY